MRSELIIPNPQEVIICTTKEIGKVPYIGKECQFVPYGWAKIEDNIYPLGFKVVTSEMKSLGLRKNPNIMTFPVGKWAMLPDEKVSADNDDWGGIWTALRRGSIKTLQKYMRDQYGVETKAFLTAMYRPVFANSYRIKSQGVMLLDEIL